MILEEEYVFFQLKVITLVKFTSMKWGQTVWNLLQDYDIGFVFGGKLK